MFTEKTKKSFGLIGIILKKLLIISPRFPPVNAADHHRVRMALAYIDNFDWNVEVLCVCPDFVENERDLNLCKTIPKRIKIHKIKALPTKLTRIVGLGSLALRSFPYFIKAINTLLAKGQFDLVFISTTEFPLFALGSYISKKFKIPFVLDYQDPWLTDYYEQPGAPPPPGGHLKYQFNQTLARWLEPKVMKQAAKTICVSPAYPRVLKKSYPYLPDNHFSTIPFGASGDDFKIAHQITLPKKLSNIFRTGQTWLYVGVVPDSMQFTLRSFFKALRKARAKRPGRFNKLKIYFWGTDYAPAGKSRKRVEPIAKEFDLLNVIVEKTERIPYFLVLKMLMNADALVIPGSDDPGYTASKLYPYILAKKPLLTIFHEASSVVKVMHETKAGTNVTFSGTTQGDQDKCSEKIFNQWFKSGYERNPETDWVAFEPYTASEMTRRLCSVFDAALTD